MVGSNKHSNESLYSSSNHFLDNCFGFYAISTVFQSISSDSSEIHVSWTIFKPFPNDFYSSKLKKFEDDNFKFDENGKKFSKRLKNTMGKGEIARYEQFLLFPQCFQATYTANT